MYGTHSAPSSTFVFYSCFFFFGAFLYQQGVSVRRWWTIALLPAAFAFCIRWLLSSPSFTVRYLSDASYWMYLAHLPLVIVAHWVLVDWPISYHWKYILTCASVTALLLITYQLFVRYTFIGNVLNGPRTRRQSSVQPAVPTSA